MPGLYHLRMCCLKTGNIPDRNILNVWIICIVINVVLVIVFCSPEQRIGHHLGCYRRTVFTRFVELINVGFGHRFFMRISIENNRPVLGSIVGSLPVYLRRIFLRFKVYFEQLRIGYFSAVVVNIHCLSVACSARLHIFICRIGLCAASIAGYAVYNPFDTFCATTFAFCGDTV